GREESDRLAAEHGGAYVAATVLQADDPWADAVHDIEAFGPVTSIITYSDTEEAVALAARGRGSLVGSVITHDAEFATEFVRPVAALRCRTSSTAGPVAPAAVRRWAVCAVSSTSCSAPRSRPPQTCSPRSAGNGWAVRSAASASIRSRSR